MKMMMIGCLLVGLFYPMQASAEAVTGETVCGETKVVIKAEPIEEGSSAYASMEMLMRNHRFAKVLTSFDAEYLHAACLQGKDGRYFIVYQNYCGGSACRDLDNYGIVDAKTLKVLLKPNDHNRSQAKQILGFPPPHLFHAKDSFFH